jgi:1,4-dihydroxy-2-naphthoate polyprenyltransferase
MVEAGAGRAIGPLEPTPAALCGPGLGAAIRRRLLATRPPFLTASALPVVVGTAWGATQAGVVSWWPAVCALLGVVLLHAAANVLNDVGDELGGTDRLNSQRIYPYTGGSRFIQNGVLSVEQMRNWGVTLLTLAVLPGLALLALRGPAILWLGAAGIALGVAYSLRPFALASRGLGEIAVALAFGLLPGVAAAWLQSGRVDGDALWVVLPTTFWVTAILLINEVPDVAADGAAGKRTLPVRFGLAATTVLYRALQLGTVLALGVAVLRELVHPAVLLLPLILAALTWRGATAIEAPGESRQALRAAIELTLRTHALGSLWVAGWIIARSL